MSRIRGVVNFVDLHPDLVDNYFTYSHTYTPSLPPSIPPPPKKHTHTLTDHQLLHAVAHSNLQSSTQGARHEHVLLHQAVPLWLPGSGEMAEEGGHEETPAAAGPCPCQHVPLGTGSCQL